MNAPVACLLGWLAGGLMVDKMLRHNVTHIIFTPRLFLVRCVSLSVLVSLLFCLVVLLPLFFSSMLRLINSANKHLDMLTPFLKSVTDTTN